MKVRRGAIKLKTGYPLMPQDHGLVSALGTLSKHYVRTIIIIPLWLTIIIIEYFSFLMFFVARCSSINYVSFLQYDKIANTNNSG